MIRPWQMIVLCVVGLLVLGLVMVSSAGMSIQHQNAVSVVGILTSRTAIYVAMALASLTITSLLGGRALNKIESAAQHRREHPHRWENLTDITPGLRANADLILAGLMIVSLMALVYIPGLGREVNGSARWIEVPMPGLGATSIQPSEIVKWLMVGVMAWYGATRLPRMDRFATGLLPALACLGLVSGLIVLEDLGTGVLIGTAGLAVLIAAGARLWQVALLAPIAALGLLAAIFTSPYRVARLTAFADPYADPEGTGYHLIQSLIAVANGRVSGRGLGHGLQKFEYLPEDQTDFLFAIICEELGIFGAGLVMVLMATLLWTIGSIAMQQTQPLRRLICVGVMTVLGVQSAINLMVVTGLAPTKGIALPLMSAGGTGWVLTAGMLGLIVAMDRTRQRETDTNETTANLDIETTNARDWLDDAADTPHQGAQHAHMV